MFLPPQSKFCILRGSPCALSASGPLRASACPLKANASAGLLHLPGWHFYFSLNSNTHLLELHRGWGGSPVGGDPFALEQDKSSVQVAPLLPGHTLVPVCKGSAWWGCRAGRRAVSTCRPPFHSAWPVPGSSRVCRGQKSWLW